MWARPRRLQTEREFVWSALSFGRSFRVGDRNWDLVLLSLYLRPQPQHSPTHRPSRGAPPHVRPSAAHTSSPNTGVACYTAFSVAISLRRH